MSDNNYASFGARWGAQIIDYVLLTAINYIVIIPLLAVIGFSQFSFDFTSFENLSEEEIIASLPAIFGALMAANIAQYIIRVIYGTLMESGKQQGTVGKMALGIKVTDMEGNKLTISKALLRHIGKIISAFTIFIGYLIALFTENKQALHDLIAGSMVVEK